MSQAASRFQLPFTSDEWLGAIFSKLVNEPIEVIRGCDVVAELVRSEWASMDGILSDCLRPGASLEEIIDRIKLSTTMTAPDGDSRELAPGAVKAMLEFEVALRSLGERAREVRSELLLACMLTHLDDEDRGQLDGLDLNQLLGRLRQRISATLGSTRSGAGKKAPPDEQDGPLLLPPELAVSEDLTWRARSADQSSEAFPFDGDPRFDAVFEAITRALHRRGSSHVLLTGEHGVGKSTILAELARRSALGSLPFLKEKRFLSVNCRFLAPEESRQTLLGILAQVADRRDVVLCLDPFADLLRSPYGSNKLALLSALSRSRCRVIGLFTPRDYEELAAGDDAFLEFFHRVEVEEPDVPVAHKLMSHFARGLEQKYQVMIEPEAVRQAVILSSNYILNDHLPAKALKVLNRVCEDLDYERTQLGRASDRVSAEQVIGAVSETTGVPPETLRGIAERSDYEQSLKEIVFGQDHVVKEVAAELGLIKSGMTEPTKPASVMLFIGQTGTGKTEMAKALARFYSTSKRLRIYTLGNFIESHSVAGIIGVPPGYVGTDQGGRLINELNADPYGVFLLDEVDKAHPDVLQPFLNLFDEGWIVDQRGVKAFANRAIFILTTNVGQRMLSEMAGQGQTLEAITTKMKETLTQIKHTKSNRPVFSPEFLARLKRTIVFKPLDSGAMEKICRKLADELVRDWHEKRNKRLEIADALLGAISQMGHARNEKAQGREGGRIVRKLLAEVIETSLQRAVTMRSQDYLMASRIAVTVEGSPDYSDAAKLSEAVRVDFLSDTPPSV